MKYLLLLIMGINLFAFDVKPIILNQKLSNTIYDTVELTYKCIPDMRRSAYYYENDEYEVVVMVDSREVEKSNYTVIYIRPVNSRVSEDNLLSIRVDRNGKMYLVGDMILSDKDIISKQEFINKLITECKNEMQYKKDKRDYKGNSVRQRFMDKE